MNLRGSPLGPKGGANIAAKNVIVERSVRK